MSPNRSVRNRLLHPDPEFYANLWGTKRHGTTRHRRSSRDAWLNRRSRSGFIALLAAVMLSGQLLASQVVGRNQRPQLITSTPPASDEGTPVDPLAPSALTPTTGPARPEAEAGADDPADQDLATAPDATGDRQPWPVPVPVIFDTDIGNDVDDSLALAMLHGYERLGLIDLLAVTVNYNQPYAAGFVDAVNTYYGAGDTPIGAIKEGGVTDGTDSFHRQVAQNATRFPHDLATNTEAEEATVVLRRQLAAQQDLSVVIVAVGFSTNLARLLESSPDESSELDGRRLVARKVKLLVNMAGDFLRTRPEFNVYNDPASAQAVFDRWPTPIVTSEWQVGTDLPFPGEALTAVADPAANPILEALKLHARSSLGVEFPYDQPSYDLSAALYAVEPDGGYLAVGEPGQVSVDSQGVTRFTPGGHGRHQLIERPPDTATRDRIIDRYLELVAMVPDGETST